MSGSRYMYEAERHWSIVDAQLGKGRYMVADTYSIVDMSVCGWARALPFIFGPQGWEQHPNVKRLVDEINARPAAERVPALATRYEFKQETNKESRCAMFPQNARLATVREG